MRVAGCSTGCSTLWEWPHTGTAVDWAPVMAPCHHHKIQFMGWGGRAAETSPTLHCSSFRFRRSSWRVSLNLEPKTWNIRYQSAEKATAVSSILQIQILHYKEKNYSHLYTALREIVALIETVRSHFLSLLLVLKGLVIFCDLGWFIETLVN